MPRIAATTAGVLALLLLVSQLVLPWLAEGEVEDRLEDRGGDASVSLSAFPALRLLFDDGDSFNVTGEGLRLDPQRRLEAFERLDGFDEVSIRLDKLEAGPLELDSFVLERRSGSREYELGLSGTTTPREVGAFIGSEAGGPFGRALGEFAGGTLPGGGTTPIPVEVDAVTARRDGEVEVSGVTGSIAGLPAGPLAEIVLDAVVSRL
jgi:hypothetical protein